MSDPDGDKIKCRWAVADESSYNAVHDDNLASLTLDTETCTVSYDGNLDNICTGSSSQVFPHYDTRGKLFENVGSNHCYKPFALVIEDFDADGNVLSAMPLTFFGQVVDDKPENCIVEDVDNDDNEDDEDEEYLSLDIEKQSAMLGNFVTMPNVSSINNKRLNKIKLAATFMQRSTTKKCGFGTLTQDMADEWYATESDLEMTGHKLLETYLADCKEKVSTKAKTKWSNIVENLKKMDEKIIAKNAKKAG